ncbi:hypothetical protein DEIGR_200218 [Deinococcus grandis]|uniref:Uncharacterized protein n=1 Tax=Deinococcus grandis TaxID=57498 RepID=A0A100HME2_9DEIO|nr:hypothetical protein DEGR_34020 [Deinococcus grandis]GAQ23363.1 hypothetical protein DEIGR_200218 [Deinococcus grandis]
MTPERRCHQPPGTAGHTGGMTLILALSAIALPLVVLPVLYPNRDQSAE